MLWSAQREEQYLCDFSVSTVRKSTNSGHRKPPLRGGTMRYRAGIIPTSQAKARRKRATLLQRLGNACCMRFVHAECSRARLLACVLQQLQRTSSFRLHESLTSRSKDESLSLRQSSLCFCPSRRVCDLMRFLSLRVFLILSSDLGTGGCEKLSFSSRGSAPRPAGAPPQTPSRTHMSYRARGRAPPEFPWYFRL